MADAGSVEINTTVHASPRHVYDLVADLPRMGEWSPECRGVDWRRGARGAVAGAHFRGRNRHGWHRWNTRGVIVRAEPAHSLAWETSFLGLPMARWTYSFEPHEDGCRVTERWDDRQLFLTRPWIVGWLVTGTRSRSDRNAETMRATLDRLRTDAEMTARTG